ncbi:MAG TPA: glycosyltransferase family 1 protein [Candidatus Baltobacteraceae bacterium]
MLRLAVDARVVADDTRGIGRYARAILRRLVARDDVALTLLVQGPFAFRRRRALATALGSKDFRVSSRASRRDDVIWHPANGTFFRSNLPSVATIHDAVPFRYPADDARKRANDQDPFLRSARTATQFVAVSEFGRGEISSVFNLSPERIAVIYHGVESSFAPGVADPLPRGLETGRYLLFVGDPIGEPRKNFFLLYEAYRRAFPSQDAAPPLAIAGSQAPQLPGIVGVGNVGDDLSARDDRRLRALYRGAIVLALPSYHETFGMPMIEAMACGTPVIASQSSCLPEIGAEAPLYAAPDDAAAWSMALRRIVDDAALRDRLRIAGLDRATNFSWDESARAHLELFRAVAQA